MNKKPPSSNRERQGTNIAPELVEIAGGKYAMPTGKAKDNGEWMGAGEPIQPVAQETEGRRFDYPTYVNTTNKPKTTEGVTFDQLRTIADLYDPLRLVIESRKDQLAKQQWTIRKKVKKGAKKVAAPKDDALGNEALGGEVDPLKPKGEVKKSGDRTEELNDIFNRPDGVHDWAEWLRMLAEDMLVIDAATVYPRKTLGGAVFSFEPVDGATIKVILDNGGRTPLPPYPAYQQFLKGMAASNFTSEELVYKPRNIRTNKIYGYSPVEQVVNTVQIGLRRQLNQLTYFTEGTVPSSFMGVPETWTADQIREWQIWFDNLLAGQDTERHKVRFVAKAMADSFKETKAPPLKDLFDEWLMRIISYAFSIDVTPFVAQVNRSVADNTKETALAEGLVPLMNWVKSLINYLLEKFLDAKDYEFEWEEEDSVKPLDQASIHKTYIDAGVLTEDEVREDLGKEPFTAEQTAAQSAKAAAKMPQVMGPDGKPAPPKEGEIDPKANAPKPSAPPAPVEKVEVHVHNHVAQPDVFLDVGPTTINATVDGITKSATVERSDS